MEQKPRTLLILIGITFVISLISMTTGCQISSGWQDLTMEERLVLSDIIVYGKTTQHVASAATIGGKTRYFIDAIFDVYCVLKSDEDDVPKEITISMVAPRDKCSGTRKYMGIENEAIIGLKKNPNGKYEYDEMMPTLSATFSPSKTNLFIVSQICGLQNWAAPVGALENRCPICGISNFTEASKNADEEEVNSPCVINGIDFGNSTACDLFRSERSDNTTVCVPTTFTRTCQQMTVFENDVECDCSKDTSGNGNNIYVSLANRFVPSYVYMFLIAVVSFLCNL